MKRMTNDISKYGLLKKIGALLLVIASSYPVFAQQKIFYPPQ
jgi:hypothetical protein